MKNNEQSSVNTGEKQDARWKPGQSGNPEGKKPGARNKATLLAEALLDGQVEELVQKCINMALVGDSTAMKILMDRIISPKKETPIKIKLPNMVDMEGIKKGLALITNAVGEGEITPGEGQILFGLIDGYRKALEGLELEKRVERLEKTVGTE